MTMKPRPYQKNGIHLPLEFAATLRALRRSRDYRLAPTLAAAHEAGWTYQLLADELGLAIEGVRQTALKDPKGYDALPVPALPEVEPRPRPKRPRTAELTSEQVAELRALTMAWKRSPMASAAEAHSRSALRSAVYDHWARGVSRTRLAEAVGTTDLSIGAYITEYRKVAEKEEAGRPLSADETKRAKQVEREAYAQSKAWMAEEKARAGGQH